MQHPKAIPAEYLRSLADFLLRDLKSDVPIRRDGALFRLRRARPEFAGHSADAVIKNVRRSDALDAIAIEAGFPNWREASKGEPSTPAAPAPLEIRKPALRFAPGFGEAQPGQRFTLYTRSGVPIAGTSEMVPATSYISGVELLPDGAIEPLHTGEQETWEDNQFTRAEDGEDLYVCTEGQEWKLSDLVLVPASVDEDEMQEFGKAILAGARYYVCEGWGHIFSDGGERDVRFALDVTTSRVIAMQIHRNGVWAAAPRVAELDVEKSLHDNDIFSDALRYVEGEWEPNDLMPFDPECLTNLLPDWASES